jgi:hypothetical protein
MELNRTAFYYSPSEGITFKTLHYDYLATMEEDSTQQLDIREVSDDTQIPG